MVIAASTIGKLDGSGKSQAEIRNQKEFRSMRSRVLICRQTSRGTLPALPAKGKMKRNCDFLLQVKWLHNLKWFVSVRRSLYRKRAKNCACSATFFRCFSIRLKAGLNFWSFFFKKKDE